MAPYIPKTDQLTMINWIYTERPSRILNVYFPQKETF
jgi:hypothetical protein